MRLVVLDGPSKGKDVDVSGREVLIGRSSSATVRLPLDPLVSRLHCKVLAEGGSYFVEDLGSGNGTWLGGELVRDKQPLPERTFVRVGHTHLCLLDESGDEENAREELARFLSAHPEAAPPESSSAGGKRPGKRGVVAAATGEHGPVVTTVDRGDADVFVQNKLDVTADPTMEQPGRKPTVESLRKRLQTFQKLGQALAGKVDTKDVLETAIDHILEVVKADRAFVLLVLDDSGSKLRSIVSRQKQGATSLEVSLSKTLLRHVIGDKVAVLVHDSKADERFSGAQSILMSGALRSVICAPLLVDGRVSAMIHLDTQSAFSFTDEDLALVTAIAQQASLAMANAKLYEQLKGAYEELESAHDQLVQSEQLSMVGTLTASIAHDMGNALTPMVAVERMVRKSSDINPKLKDAFSRQMQRLKALAQQLKSFSRPSEAAFAETDVNAALADSLMLFQTEARHHEVKIRTELAEDLPPVRADANMIDQVFVNLGLNAVQAMRETGDTLMIRTEADGDEVVVSFIDNGPGIPAEHLPNLFQAFFTTKGKKGTGLGLFSCRRIVEEDHGGRLVVDTEVGRGTTFQVRLPVAAAEG